MALTWNPVLFSWPKVGLLEVVRQDHNLEQIVFPIPEICEYLTDITKFDVREHSEVDEQGSKVTDFFAKTEDMYEEMKWQKKLRSSPALFWVSKKAITWKAITIICSLFINIILMLFYPSNTIPSKYNFNLCPILNIFNY